MADPYTSRLRAALSALLQTTELNMDDMEPETQDAIDEAEAVLAESAPVFNGAAILGPASRRAGDITHDAGDDCA